MERGIEQAMDAILEVPSAVLVLMGFGPLEGRGSPSASSRPPYLGRVLLLPAVPPDDAADLEASADVAGHGHPADDAQPPVHDTAEAVREPRGRRPGRGVGPARAWPRSSARPAPACVCDPTSPTSIAGGDLVDRDGVTGGSPRPARTRPGGGARAQYNWEAQLGTLFGALPRAAPAGVEAPGR